MTTLVEALMVLVAVAIWAKIAHLMIYVFRHTPSEG